MATFVEAFQVVLFFICAVGLASLACTSEEEMKLWDEWKRLHFKSYVDANEEHIRHAIWCSNLKVFSYWNKRYVDSLKCKKHLCHEFVGVFCRWFFICVLCVVIRVLLFCYVCLTAVYNYPEIVTKQNC